MESDRLARYREAVYRVQRSIFLRARILLPVADRALERKCHPTHTVSGAFRLLPRGLHDGTGGVISATHWPCDNPPEESNAVPRRRGRARLQPRRVDSRPTQRPSDHKLSTGFRRRSAGGDGGSREATLWPWS